MTNKNNAYMIPPIHIPSYCSSYENDYVSYTIKDDILIQTYKNKAAHMTLDIAKQIVRDRQLLTQGKPMLNLSVLNFMCTADRDALEYFGTAPESLGDVLAGCLVVNNWIRYTITMAWIFTFRSSMQFPIHIVRSTEEGVSWLRSKPVDQKPILHWGKM